MFVPLSVELLKPGKSSAYMAFCTSDYSTVCGIIDSDYKRNPDIVKNFKETKRGAKRHAEFAVGCGTVMGLLPSHGGKGAEPRAHGSAGKCQGEGTQGTGARAGAESTFQALGRPPQGFH